MSSGIILGAIGIYTLGFGLMVFTIYIIRKRNRDKLEKELVWHKPSLVLRQTCSAFILWSVVERVRS